MPKAAPCIDLTGDSPKRKTKKKILSSKRSREPLSDDDAVVIVEPADRPQKKPKRQLRGKKVADDVMITHETGTEALRDLPHTRPQCGNHAFKTTSSRSNSVCCPQCYCYVCDVKASECKDWGSGAKAEHHCNAHMSSYWNPLKRAARARNITNSSSGGSKATAAAPPAAASHKSSAKSSARRSTAAGISQNAAAATAGTSSGRTTAALGSGTLRRRPSNQLARSARNSSHAHASSYAELQAAGAAAAARQLLDAMQAQTAAMLERLRAMAPDSSDDSDESDETGPEDESGSDDSADYRWSSRRAHSRW